MTMASRNTVLDLFSGIGGFSLGLTMAGFRTTAFCEIEDYPRSILRKHWPNVPIFEDVRELHAADLPEPVTVICGGYPCQPFSLAGQRKGQDDDRHLWPEIVRIIRELDATTGKPAWCVFENVAGHVSMGLDQVLADLEGEGYTAWPFIIPACALNAQHRRDRVWIVAHHEGRADREYNSGTMQRQKPKPGKGISFAIIPNTSRQGGVFKPWFSANHSANGDWRGQTGEWITLPGVRARDDGLPNRVARLKALGNAVVPQIPELIGTIIMAVEHEKEVISMPGCGGGKKK